MFSEENMPLYTSDSSEKSKGNSYMLNFNIDNFEEYKIFGNEEDVTGFLSKLSDSSYIREGEAAYCLQNENKCEFSIFVSNMSDDRVAVYIGQIIENAEKTVKLKVSCVSKSAYNTVSEIKNMVLRNKEHNEIAEKVDDYIKENYMKKISLETISELFHFNKEYFSYMYKKLSGKTLTDRIQEVRLNVASELLINTDLKIGEIVINTGYTSQSYFTRIFTAEYGVTPSEYRKKNQIQL